MKSLKLCLFATVVLTAPILLFADDYYDDDIYYDESKAKTKKSNKTESNTNSAEYSASFGSSSRDVDEYNRQGAYYTTDTVA